MVVVCLHAHEYDYGWGLTFSRMPHASLCPLPACNVEKWVGNEATCTYKSSLTFRVGNSSKMNTSWTITYSIGKHAEDIGCGWFESIHYVCQSRIAHDIKHHFTSITIRFFHKNLKATNDSIT